MFERLLVAMAFAVSVSPVVASADDLDLNQLDKLEGFINLYHDDAAGRVYLEVPALDEPFIYQASLARGVGSNDIGLDRGQLGSTKVVRFIQSGPKVLLVEDNLAYRADSDNIDERDAIAESFARSVIWGFEDLDPDAATIIVDATPFFVRDAHGVTGGAAVAAGRRLQRG